MPDLARQSGESSLAADLTRQRDRFYGPILMTSASLCAALLASMVKWASHGYSTELILAMRYAVSLLLVLYLQPQNFRDHLAACLRPSLLVLQALCMVVGALCFYLSIRFVPLLEALLLVNTAPFFAPLFAWLIFKKKEKPLAWLGIAIGMAGVVLVLRPGAEDFKAPVLFALAAGVMSAMQLTLSAELIEREGKDRIAISIQFYGVIAASIAVLFIGVGPADWQKVDINHPAWATGWLDALLLVIFLLSMGGLSILSPMLSALSCKSCSLGQVTPFKYVSIIFGGLIGWLVWETVPSYMTLWGFLLISIGGVCAVLGGQTAHHHECSLHG